MSDDDCKQVDRLCFNDDPLIAAFKLGHEGGMSFKDGWGGEGGEEIGDLK